MPIFDDVDRNNAAPAGHGESTFTFLNRIPGEYWEQVRLLLQAWASRIDHPGEYESIRSRFRKADNYVFNSTFLELYLHECLLRAGYAVTIHPDVPGTSRHPDFYAERDGEGFYLEAISPAASDEVKGRAARTAQLYDSVNSIRSNNFHLWVTELTTGARSVRVRQLRNMLEVWLDSLDPDDFTEVSQWPVKDWQCDDWHASFKAMPKATHHRTAHVEAIGVYPATVQRVDDAPTILGALSKKHKRYGDLAKPYIVAIGTYILGTDRFDESNALYGNLEYELMFAPDGELARVQPVRDRNGFFGIPDSWKNCHVSAVLLANQLMPYHFHKSSVATLELWRHPGAHYQLAHELGMPWAEITFNNGLGVKPSPIDPLEFFGLPSDWLAGNPWA